MNKGHNIKALVRLLFVIATMFISSPTHSQNYLKYPSKQPFIGYAKYYDGYWGEWNILKLEKLRIYGNYDDFIIYNSQCHPSQYAFKITINNFHKPSKSEANNGFGWVTYKGKVEYYVNEEHPTIKDVFKDKESLFYGPLDGTHPVKRVADAVIRIETFKKHPKCYNIFFDDVGFAIDFYKAEFKKL